MSLKNGIALLCMRWTTCRNPDLRSHDDIKHVPKRLPKEIFECDCDCLNSPLCPFAG